MANATPHQELQCALLSLWRQCIRVRLSKSLRSDVDSKIQSDDLVGPLGRTVIWPVLVEVTKVDALCEKTQSISDPGLPTNYKQNFGMD